MPEPLPAARGTWRDPPGQDGVRRRAHSPPTRPGQYTHGAPRVHVGVDETGEPRESPRGPGGAFSLCPDRGPGWGQSFFPCPCYKERTFSSQRPRAGRSQVPFRWVSIRPTESSHGCPSGRNPEPLVPAAAWEKLLGILLSRKQVPVDAETPSRTRRAQEKERRQGVSQGPGARGAPGVRLRGSCRARESPP